MIEDIPDEGAQLTPYFSESCEGSNEEGRNDTTLISG